METEKIKLLTVTSVSACFELINDDVYFVQNYSVILDGTEVLNGQNTNVFSIFDLTPNTSYQCQVKFVDNSILTTQFVTLDESVAISVADFFCHADGVQFDTKALQAAFDVCPPNGRVIIPKGTYLTAPLVLRSEITVELKQGATILGSNNIDDYQILPGELNSRCSQNVSIVSTWEGNPLKCFQSLLSSHNQTDITIVGKGKIDGNAPNSKWYDEAKNTERGRPRLVFFNSCSNIILHGNTFTNSASWTIHPFFCKSVKAFDIEVSCPADSPNTDGFNPESCDGVQIIGCKIASGDDCIAIKSGKFDMAKRFNTPCKNIEIRNCLMKDGHGSVVLGSELSAGIYNLKVSQCMFLGTDRGLRIKTRRGRGKMAVIQNVSFNNIIMRDVLTPFVINSFYHCCDPDGKSEYVKSKKPLPLDDRTPILGKFVFDSITCYNVHFACGFFYGLPEQPIQEVKLNNVHFSIAKNARKGYPAMLCDVGECSKRGIIALNVKSLLLNNVSFNGIVGEQVDKI
ncbi:MAG: glycoside hydrolase family 28 protein [Clostridiales bacterium]|nr:glycoside hydrolase family 28 protein [Clostridiales bacterium]